MPTSSEINQMTDAVVQPIRILLAEADPVEIDRIRSVIDPKFHHGIKIANNYHELLANLAQKRPQLVILGKIDKSSYSEIADECHQLRRNLPIFLLSSQGIIIDSFRQLVKSCGLTDVITRDSSSLNQLFQAAENHARELSMRKLADKSMLANLTSQPLGQVAVQPTPQSTSEQIEQLPTISGRIMLAGLQEIVVISNNYFGPLAQGIPLENLIKLTGMVN
jgi:CheY-like chemotaxis protein